MKNISRILIAPLCMALVSAANAASLPRGTEYKSLQGNIIRIISSNEVESVEMSTTIVGSYSIDKSVARMVFDALGTRVAVYFDISEDGLIEKKSGTVYYLPEKYEVAKQKRDEERARKKLADEHERVRKEQEAAVERENEGKAAAQRRERREAEEEERRQKASIEAKERKERNERNKALLQAAKDGDKQKVQQLLDQGVDLNTQDFNGRTPLMNASRHGQIEIVRLLVQSKADINFKNHWGTTALGWAKREKRTDVVEYLAENGAQ